MREFDLLVIGSGPAGQKAAIQAAKLRKRVAVIEKERVLGGSCINTGTLPSKTLKDAIYYLHGFKLRSFTNITYSLKKNMTLRDLMARKDLVIRHELEVITNQLERNDVEIIQGTASFADPHTLRAVTNIVDQEIVQALIYHMRTNGVTMRLGEQLDKVTSDEQGRVVTTFKSGKTIVTDVLLYAMGRIANTDTLNLAAAGITTDKTGQLKVNEHYQTEVPHIYAAGDVIGFPALASTSMEQGRLACCHAFNVAQSALPKVLPYGIYTIPEISTVGKSEEELTKEGVPYEIGRAFYKEIARGQIVGDLEGLLKLIFHRTTLKLLGVHILGDGATELVHIGQAVLTYGGTVDFFVHNVFNYPTLAECYRTAALDGINRLARP